MTLIGIWIVRIATDLHGLIKMLNDTAQIRQVVLGFNGFHVKSIGINYLLANIREHHL